MLSPLYQHRFSTCAHRGRAQSMFEKENVLQARAIGWGTAEWVVVAWCWRLCGIIEAAIPVISNTVVNGASLIFLLQRSIAGQFRVAGHVVVIDTTKGDRPSNVWDMVETGWASVHVLILTVSEWGRDVLFYSSKVD